VNTEQFLRKRIQKALDESIGKIPDLAPSIEHRIHSQSLGRFPLAAQLAATLAILFGGIILLFSLHHSSVGTPNVVSSPATATTDSTPCALPVEVTATFQNPGQNPDISTTLGFVNIPAGTFRVDPNTTVQDLPGSDPLGERMYSAQLKRWLPASSRTISPDGRYAAFVKRGEQLAKVGDAAKDLQSCNNCHGPGGAGEPPAIPYLGGQYARYTAFQLTMWKRGFRKNSPDSMADIAKRLDDQEIAAVAAYFQQVNASALAATHPKE